MTPRVLLVEDDDERAEWMGRELAGLTLERAPDSAHALAALEGGPAYDVIMLDYDIDPDGGGGHHVVAHLQQRSGSAIIIVHSANPLGGPWMAFALKRAGYETTYAPVFDPESPDAWRSILGGEPVIGEWGCPSSHPALSLSKKGECALCVLAPKTHWYYEDDQCVLLDCLTCGSPMVVSKRHDEWTDDELADLIELATEGFPDLQPRLRRGSIPDHPHFHMEERASNPSGLFYHGTTAAKAKAIRERGFDLSLHGERQQAVHGRAAELSGVYLTADPTHAEWYGPAVLSVVVAGELMPSSEWWELRHELSERFPGGLYDEENNRLIREMAKEEAVRRRFVGFVENEDPHEIVVFDPANVRVERERGSNPRTSLRTSLTPQAIKKLERRFRKGVKLWRGVGGTPRDPGDLGIGTYHSSYRARARQYADSDLIAPTVRLDAPLVLGDEDAYTQIADRYGTVRAPGSRRRHDPRRWGLRERTRGAVQATVDMIEAGYDGLVSVNTLTGGLEVVVFPALEEIVWP